MINGGSRKGRSFLRHIPGVKGSRWCYWSLIFRIGKDRNLYEKGGRFLCQYSLLITVYIVLLSRDKFFIINAWNRHTLLNGETGFLGESIKWIWLLPLKDAATPSSALYIDCVTLVGGRSDIRDVGFMRFPWTLPVERDPIISSGVVITAFAKDTNDRAANIFVKTKANIMIDCFFKNYWCANGQRFADEVWQDGLIMRGSSVC